jgi:hypothetical protein
MMSISGPAHALITERGTKSTSRVLPCRRRAVDSWENTGVMDLCAGMPPTPFGAPSRTKDGAPGRLAGLRGLYKSEWSEAIRCILYGSYRI